MTYYLGLTGGIASGKSTVSDLFRHKNIPVIDADEVAHALMEPGAANWQKIVAKFGPQFLNADQTINRQKLAQLVFSDQNALSKLNHLSHPTIKTSLLNKMQEYAIQNARVVVVDIPLLYEGKFDTDLDDVLLVYVDNKTQLERLMARDAITVKEAKRKIAAQMPLAKKKLLADYLIDNTGTIEETTSSFEAFFRANISPKLEE